MKVKLLTLYTGAKGRHNPGAVISVSDDEGKQLVRGGYAFEVKDASEIETTSMSAPETAVAPAQRKRGRPRKADV